MVPIDEERVPLLWECGINIDELATSHKDDRVYSFCVNSNPETGGDVFRCVLNLDSFELSVERLFNCLAVFAGTEKAPTGYLKT